MLAAFLCESCVDNSSVSAEEISWCGPAGDRAEEADELFNISGSGIDWIGIGSSGGEDAVGSVGASDLGVVTRVGISASALIRVHRGRQCEAVAVTTVLNREIFGALTSGIASGVCHRIAVENCGLSASGDFVGATDVVEVLWRRVVGAVTRRRLLIVSSCRSSRSDSLICSVFKAV